MAPSSKASTGSKDLIPKMKVEPQWTRSYLVDQVGVQDFGLLEYNFGKSANGVSEACNSPLRAIAKQISNFMTQTSYLERLKK